MPKYSTLSNASVQVYKHRIRQSTLLALKIAKVVKHDIIYVFCKVIKTESHSVKIYALHFIIDYLSLSSLKHTPILNRL